MVCYILQLILSYLENSLVLWDTGNAMNIQWQSEDIPIQKFRHARPLIEPSVAEQRFMHLLNFLHHLLHHHQHIHGKGLVNGSIIYCQMLIYYNVVQDKSAIKCSNYLFYTGYGDDPGKNEISF